MKHFQSHDTPNSQKVWQIENYVSDYTDGHYFFSNSSVVIGGDRPLLALYISVARS